MPGYGRDRSGDCAGKGRRNGVPCQQRSHRSGVGLAVGEVTGLTAECLRTHQVQRCEDALVDPRADAEASRRLGVRSVMIVPVLRNGELAGVLEVFFVEGRGVRR